VPNRGTSNPPLTPGEAQVLTPGAVGGRQGGLSGHRGTASRKAPLWGTPGASMAHINSPTFTTFGLGNVDWAGLLKKGRRGTIFWVLPGGGGGKGWVTKPTGRRLHWKAANLTEKNLMVFPTAFTFQVLPPTEGEPTSGTTKPGSEGGGGTAPTLKGRNP